jgi:hypothetical protein
LAHTITQSIIAQTRPQPDGRSYVTEQHTWDDARVTRILYLAAAGLDTAAKMAARVAMLVAERDTEDLTASNVALADSIRAKLLAFLTPLTDNQLKSQLNLTNAELALLRASDFVSIAGRINFG